MRLNRRWQLNDLQRLLVALMVCAAFFLSAMAWGSGSLAMLLIAAVLVLIVGLSVFPWVCATAPAPADRVRPTW